MVTLWAFLVQVLSGSKSCVVAVARIIVLSVALERSLPSTHTGAYCKARAKLPERFLHRLTVLVGTELEDRAPATWRGHGKRAHLVDGTTVTLPATEATQRAYPQPKTQKKGLGYPILRLVVVLSLATAGLLDAACGPYHGKETGATALFRQLLPGLRAGDLVVAARYYCSYWMIALLLQQDVDAAFRLQQRRHYDFRRGQRLGAGDHVVTWTKPARPAGMDAATSAALPETLTIREVLVQVTQPGYRTRQLVVATTLLDAATYAKQDIGALYQRRWHVELDLRSIQQTLRMEHLSCKTPEMARRELWAHLLGYNLVRQALAEAALQAKLTPRQLSFAGGLQTLQAFRWLLRTRPSGSPAVTPVATIVVQAVATHRVGDRPGRVEPRRKKRRPKT